MKQGIEGRPANAEPQSPKAQQGNYVQKVFAPKSEYNQSPPRTPQSRSFISEAETPKSVAKTNEATLADNIAINLNAGLGDLV